MEENVVAPWMGETGRNENFPDPQVIVKLRTVEYGLWFQGRKVRRCCRYKTIHVSFSCVKAQHALHPCVFPCPCGHSHRQCISAASTLMLVAVLPHVLRRVRFYVAGPLLITERMPR